MKVKSLILKKNNMKEINFTLIHLIHEYKERLSSKIKKENDTINII